jgi:hypothetical protein
MNSGEYANITYTFNESAGTSAHITQRTAQFTLLDGTTPVSDPIGPYANDINVPANGAAQWVDNVYLPPDVVSNAQTYSASAVLLRTTFSGQDPLSRSVSVQSDLQINFGGPTQDSVQIIKVWTSDVCSSSAPEKTQFSPGETSRLIIQANNLEDSNIDTKWTWLVEYPDGSTENVHTDFPVSMHPAINTWCSDPYSMPNTPGVYTFTGKITWGAGEYQDLKSTTFEVVGGPAQDLVRILKVWTSSDVCSSSAPEKTQFSPGETSRLIIQANNLEDSNIDTKWTWLVEYPDGSTENVHTDFPVSMHPAINTWCSDLYTIPDVLGTYTFTGQLTWNDGRYQDQKSTTFEVVAIPGGEENKVFLPIILE